MLNAKTMINLFWYELGSTNLVFQGSSSTSPPPATTLWVLLQLVILSLMLMVLGRLLIVLVAEVCSGKLTVLGMWVSLQNSSLPLSLLRNFMALKEGLTMAQDFNMDCLIIEMDALELKSMLLTNVENFQNSALANLIRDITTILNRNACYSIMHSKRSANSLAHLLSQEGANLSASKAT